ncbi:GRF1-interacting factor 2-like isoform X2 [Telopea speciosissima]|uniref:GRF1-interacting factor 2-like isoform X2 n=1 Tax=Telopea speciosissima TaxID=54955 RepID=UPI001CC6F965|nr:GRF1-interacting factor 2-like isoform X2 [Telopea speciosissima]
MQQSQQMLPMIPSFPPRNITTEQIQKFLDENKKLILAILDNQNLGKLAECAQYQAQLQKNLMYLAAIADAQPQAASMPPQMAPQPVMQQGGQSGQYMQYSQAAMARQPGVFSPRNPLQFNPQQIQEYQQQLQLHQQSMQGHMGMRSGANNGMLAMHNETILGGGSGASQPSSVGRSEFMHSGGGGASSGSLDVRGESKHDVLEVGSGDGQGNLAAGHGTADEEDGN